MTTLIIARHGNTFNPEDTPTRIGKHTDLPLVEKGEAQGRALGRYLRDHNLLPDVAYSSTLQRTRKMAVLALKEASISLPVYALDIFDEIDYGPDENKCEKDVIARIGKEAITLWNEKAIVPDGWQVDPHKIIMDWQRFAHQITKTNDTITNQIMDIAETVLVVTSNGVARFAPHITEDFDTFLQKFSIKLKPGALGILRFSDQSWHVEDWNIVPVLN
ncbi:MAG: histidine phosphatase family protein [Alphaproteobacteria bacterium]|nr:histidine phosphatase family protein [Alphaproteobacteria bacterium]